jgi:alkylation response protein AidB-like acyl-CoA dehydrogenase
MDFALDKQQLALIENARTFIKVKLTDEAARYRDTMIPKEEAKKLLKRIEPFGFMGSLIPGEEGGSGLDFLTTILLYEELFRVFPDLGGIAMVNQAVGYGIYTDGTPEQRKRYLPGLISGDLIGAQAATEDCAGSNPRAIRMQASSEGDGYRLNGRKLWISNGSISDFCIVLVRTDDGETNRLVVDADAYTSREEHLMGQHAQSHAELNFENSWVPNSQLMGRSGEGAKSTIRDFSIMRCFVAIWSVGLAQAALEAAVKYAREREQWYKPIGQHQLVQEMIADMATELQCARLLAYRAAWMLDQKGPSETEASMAKYYCTEAAVRITSKAVQIHGALGLSRELPIEGYFRDARMMTIPDGTSQLQQLILARNILGMAAFGDSRRSREASAKASQAG